MTANRAGQRSTDKSWETWGQSTLSRLLLISSQNASWVNGQEESKVVQLSGSPSVGQDDPRSGSEIMTSWLFFFFFFFFTLTSRFSLLHCSTPSNHSFHIVNTLQSSSGAVVQRPWGNEQKEVHALIFQHWVVLSIKMLCSSTKGSEPFMGSSKLSCQPRSQL